MPVRLARPALFTRSPYLQAASQCQTADLGSPLPLRYTMRIPCVSYMEGVWLHPQSRPCAIRYASHIPGPVYLTVRPARPTLLTRSPYLQVASTTRQAYAVCT